MKRKESTTAVMEPPPGTPQQPTRGHIDLRSRAMLCTLKLRKWGATITDDVITEDVQQRTGMAEDRGRFEKKLLSKDALAKQQAAYSRIKSIFKRYTRPWGDQWATGIVSAPALAKLKREIDTAIADYDQLFHDELASPGPAGRSKYLDKVYAEQAALGTSWKLSDYPTIEELKTKYEARVRFHGIPDEADIRIDVSKEIIDQIREEQKDYVAQSLNTVMAGLFGELRGMVEDLIGAMDESSATPEQTIQTLIGKLQNSPSLTAAELSDITKQVEALQKDVGKASSIRATLFKKIDAFCQRIPDLNFSGDAKLDEFAQSIRSLIATGDAKELAATLRDTPAARGEIRDRAQEILAEMQDWFGGFEGDERA